MILGNQTVLTWTVPLAGVTTTGDASGSVASDWIPTRHKSVSLQLLWTGTPAGTLTLLLSNDKSNTAATLAVSDFVPAMSNPAGGASGTACQFTTHFLWYKVNYAQSSGSGGITGVATEKV